MENKYYYDKHKQQTCFMCDKLATTGTHIPPQGFFTTSLRKSRDYKPLKVPACEEHNNFSEKDDEYVRTILSAGSYDQEKAEKLFRERISVGKDKKLLKKIIDSMKPNFLRRSSGILEHNISIDRQRFQTVINKIVHGLYWHHNGYRIPDGYEVSEYIWNRQLPGESRDIVISIPILSVGHPSVFQYKYANLGSNKNEVYIAICFFEKDLVEATIYNKESFPED